MSYICNVIKNNITMGKLIGNLYKNGTNRLVVIGESTFSHVTCHEWGETIRKATKTIRAKSELDSMILICENLPV